MRRFLVFTGLFPPLVLLVYIMSDQLWREGLPEIGFLAWLLGIAYLLALVPAWLTAAVDGMLSRQPLYVRLIATTAVAAILAELVGRYMGQPHFDVPVAIAGAIPAAVCLWLSVEPKQSLAPRGKKARPTPCCPTGVRRYVGRLTGNCLPNI